MEASANIPVKSAVAKYDSLFLMYLSLSAMVRIYTLGED